MIDCLLSWVKAQDGYILFSVAKIGGKPFSYIPSNSIVSKFFKKDTVIHSIKCFLEVDKDTTGDFALIEGVSDFFRDIN